MGRLDCLFELQNAVEWRMVMSRGQDERSQMHAMCLLLNTCTGADDARTSQSDAKTLKTVQRDLLRITILCRWRKNLLLDLV